MPDSAAHAGDELAPPAPETRRGRSGALAGLAGAAVGAGGALLILKILPGLGQTTLHALRAGYGAWTLPIIVTFSIILIFAAIAVHEAGHVAAGVAAGMRFMLFAAGPVRIEREYDGGRLAVSWNRSLGLWGGIAGCLPATTDRIRRQLALMVGGGPAASLLFALVAGWVALRVPMPPLAGFVAGMAATMSAAIGAATLIPMRTGGFMSDGGQLLRLARGGPRADRHAATVTLVTRMMWGEPVRDWPRPQVDRLVELRDGSLEESMAWSMAYYYHLDTGDRPAAARAWHRAMALLDRWPAPLVPAMHVEAAYFAAISGDAEAARTHLAAVPPVSASVKPYERNRALAALALAEGDTARAVELARQALDILPKTSAFSAARLHEIIRAAEGAETRPPTA
ncbi:hypothetical protein [Longimicrobium terrae]|uniref:M50 family metallopeptidase n=1 Tax=Longimicrobium terrae TaxID=1639882 RepID=A0A841H3R5_9BACT|nr:hypothetical protein [Longimicrobium terrae]MBB4638319.1 hypothetical protein [Longimicrobium terrae]MBB6072613.1 hypothetical protein [Longimicrobium terrae]NNC28608.1 hypothetical protein [Longimicrobium terrae]